MNNTSLHWTDDPELLEQYVLGKIPRERMNVLNEHLRTCPQCQHAVQAEQDFVKSVKAYGREQLRVRLKERLERTPARTVPWPHVLSAAAVVVFIVGLGIYNDWWREPDLVQSEEQIVGEKEPQSPLPPAAERGAGISEGAEKPLQDAGGETLAGKVSSERGRRERRLDAAAKDEKGGVAILPERPAAAAEVEDQVSQTGIQSEFWVDGTMTEVRSKEKGDVTGLEGAGAPGARMAEAQPQKSLLAARQGRYLLLQMPERNLPMQQKQFRKGADTVPTKVEPRPDGALLTAYTDQFDLRNRSIQGEFAGADSLVFIVDGIRIAYKLSALPAKK